MEVLTTPVLLLGLALILAIVIERILEITKCIYDYIDLRANRMHCWTLRAEKIRDRLEVRLDNAKQGDRRQFDLVMILASRYLVAADPAHGGVMAVSADKVRSVSIRYHLKFAAMLLGTGCAWLFNIDIIELVEISLLNAEDQVHASYESHWFGILIAGIAIGFGAGPMHKLIVMLEKSRNTRRNLMRKIQGN